MSRVFARQEVSKHVALTLHTTQVRLPSAHVVVLRLIREPTLVKSKCSFMHKPDHKRIGGAGKGTKVCRYNRTVLDPWAGHFQC